MHHTVKLEMIYLYVFCFLFLISLIKPVEVLFHITMLIIIKLIERLKYDLKFEFLFLIFHELFLEKKKKKKLIFFPKPLLRMLN